MTLTNRPHSPYESYVVRLYRRDGAQMAGTVENVENGTVHRFIDGASLIAFIEAHGRVPELSAGAGRRRRK